MKEKEKVPFLKKRTIIKSLSRVFRLNFMRGRSIKNNMSM